MRPMLRLYWRLTFFCSLLMVAPILLIRTRQYDDRGIRQLLQTDGCPTPCFLGIRPGITTATEAIALLRESQWVRPETIAYVEWDKGGGATWTWNKQASPLLGSRQSSFISSRRNGVQVVDILHVTTLVASGDAYLTLGTTAYTATGDTGLYNQVYMAWFYPDQGISIWSNMNCPTYNDHLWMRPIIVQFRKSVSRSERSNVQGARC